MKNIEYTYSENKNTIYGICLGGDPLKIIQIRSGLVEKELGYFTEHLQKQQFDLIINKLPICESCGHFLAEYWNRNSTYKTFYKCNNCKQIRIFKDMHHIKWIK